MQAAYVSGVTAAALKISPWQSENTVLPLLFQYVPGNGNAAD